MDVARGHQTAREAQYWHAVLSVLFLTTPSVAITPRSDLEALMRDIGRAERIVQAHGGSLRAYNEVSVPEWREPSAAWLDRAQRLEGLTATTWRRRRPTRTGSLSSPTINSTKSPNAERVAIGLNVEVRVDVQCTRRNPHHQAGENYGYRTSLYLHSAPGRNRTIRRNRQARGQDYQSDWAHHAHAERGRRRKSECFNLRNRDAELEGARRAQHPSSRPTRTGKS